MLTSIECSKFRVPKIEFHPGLNVVLGDEKATNSIGKSSLLMVIDFAFGGSSLLDHNKDIVSELGHHTYIFTFTFDGERYVFERATDQPGVVFPRSQQGDQGNPITLDRYWAFLKKSYGISSEDVSFRSLVGLYFRIWGKENIDVHKPLHAVKAQSPRDCVENLVKVFDKFDPIRKLSSDLAFKEREQKALNAAVRTQLLPKIGKRQRAENQERIEDIEREIQEIKADLAKYAANINQLVDEGMLELKVQRDGLLALRTGLQNRLLTTERNISENRHIRSEHFEALRAFFPDINSDRLVEVEEFHNGLAKLLRAELKDAERQLRHQIGEVEEQMRSIDSRMARSLASVDQPVAIIDRVYDLSNSWDRARRENDFFDKSEQIKLQVSTLKEELVNKKKEILSAIQFLMNRELERIVEVAFGSGRKSPTLLLSENNYRYEVFEDTGTGTAYSALVMFDLAVFQNTFLPCIAHDSVLFKNVENDSVAGLVEFYCSQVKQSFIAIDEVGKYGAKTSALLSSLSVIQLSDSAVLYTKDWRSRKELG